MGLYGGMFAVAESHRYSSHKAESKVMLQYGNFILLLLYYSPTSAYIGAICCCELVARAASGTTHKRVQYYRNVLACKYHEMY